MISSPGTRINLTGVVSVPAELVASVAKINNSSTGPSCWTRTGTTIGTTNDTLKALRIGRFARCVGSINPRRCENCSASWCGNSHPCDGSSTTLATGSVS